MAAVEGDHLPAAADTHVHALSELSELGVTHQSCKSVLKPHMSLQTEPSEGWTWRGPEMAAARRLLRVMAVHCLRSVAGGAACLRRLAVAARAASARGVLNGCIYSSPEAARACDGSQYEAL